MAFPSGNAGNDIIANAEDGQGGRIEINAQGVLGFSEGVAIESERTNSNRSFIRLNNGTNELDVSSTSGSNLDGPIDLNIPDVDSLQGTIETPQNPIEEKTTVSQACSANSRGSNSSLTITGKGGIPPKAIEPLNEEALIVNGSTENTQAEIPQSEAILTSAGAIVPARGIIKTEDGKVLLVGYAVSDRTRTPLKQINCN